jgi:hypothetical protein
LVEQLICNQQVIGSSPIAGSLSEQLFGVVEKSSLGHFLASFCEHPSENGWPKKSRQR